MSNRDTAGPTDRHTLGSWVKRRIAYAMTEDELLTAILEAAQWYGWRVHHVRRSDKALQQGDPGFPDLVLARGGVVLFYELKAMRGHLSHAQADWLFHLRGELIRPTDLDRVLSTLEKA